jgi:hypothetical protein
VAVIIEAELYRTNDGHDPLPRHIGPFLDATVAHDWIATQGPLWGSWMVLPVTPSESIYPGSEFRPDRSPRKYLRYGLSDTPPDPEVPVADKPELEVPDLRPAKQSGWAL